MSIREVLPLRYIQNPHTSAVPPGTFEYHPARGVSFIEHLTQLPQDQLSYFLRHDPVHDRSLVRQSSMELVYESRKALHSRLVLAMNLDFESANFSSRLWANGI